MFLASSSTGKGEKRRSGPHTGVVRNNEERTTKVNEKISKNAATAVTVSTEI